MAVSKGLGQNALIFPSGLQSIPSTVYEAARIDGANGWTQFRYVALPFLAPTTFFEGLMTLLGSLQLFAEPYTMTDGGTLDFTLSKVVYMDRTMDRVASSEPPTVIVVGSAMIWRYPIRVMIPTKNVVGAKSGKVTYLN